MKMQTYMRYPQHITPHSSQSSNLIEKLINIFSQQSCFSRDKQPVDIVNLSSSSYLSQGYRPYNSFRPIAQKAQIQNANNGLKNLFTKPKIHEIEEDQQNLFTPKKPIGFKETLFCSLASAGTVSPVTNAFLNSIISSPLQQPDFNRAAFEEDGMVNNLFEENDSDLLLRSKEEKPFLRGTREKMGRAGHSSKGTRQYEPFSTSTREKNRIARRALAAAQQEKPKVPTQHQQKNPHLGGDIVALLQAKQTVQRMGNNSKKAMASQGNSIGRPKGILKAAPEAPENDTAPESYFGRLARHFWN